MRLPSIAAKALLPASITLLATTLALTIIWACSEKNNWEPIASVASTSFALLCFIADSWGTRKEQRRSALIALHHEMHMNAGVLEAIKDVASESGPQHPLPRFFTTSTTSAITSGLFFEKNDASLWRMLHDWNHRATEINSRMQLTDMQIALGQTNAKAIAQTIIASPPIETLTSCLNQIRNELIRGYHDECEIQTLTQIFSHSPSTTSHNQSLQRTACSAVRSTL